MKKTILTFKSITYFLIIFLIVYCSHDTLLFGTNSNNVFIIARKVIPFIILFLLLCVSNFSFDGAGFIKFIILLLLPILSCIVNKEDFNNYIYRCCLMVDSFFLISIKDKSLKFIKTFNNIITFLCVWSLVFWAISSLAPSFSNYFPKIINSNGNSYPFFVFSSIDEDARYIFAFRNTGIFREPGVFASILCIAILFELSRIDLSFKRFWLYIITMVTTFSTAGIILAAVFVVYLCFFEKRITTKKRILISSALFVAALLFFIGGYSYISSTGIFDKFTQGSDSYGSWYSRLQSVFGNLNIFKNSPVFGIGRYHLYDITLATDGNYVVADNTNTYMINFAAFGFLYGALCIVGTIRYFSFKTKSVVKGLLFSILLFVALSNEDFGQNIVYFYIVVFGLLACKEKQKTLSMHTKKLNYGELLNV